MNRLVILGPLPVDARKPARRGPRAAVQLNLANPTSVRAVKAKDLSGSLRIRLVLPPSHRYVNRRGVSVNDELPHFRRREIVLPAYPRFPPIPGRRAIALSARGD